jgi:hypothetical protein
VVDLSDAVLVVSLVFLLNIESIQGKWGRKVLVVAVLLVAVLDMICCKRYMYIQYIYI